MRARRAKPGAHAPPSTSEAKCAEGGLRAGWAGGVTRPLTLTLSLALALTLTLTLALALTLALSLTLALRLTRTLTPTLALSPSGL
jgi:hypothetical protein